ncbi:MAG: hypothetical protein AAF404_09140 [Pseudomonadota bacterium]
MHRRRLLQLAATATLLPLSPYLAANANGYHGRRIILLELAGANDGLNTLVPWSDQRYYSLRPTIGLKQNKIIKLNDDFALHAALQPMMPLWESGELAVIHGLGYPQPNRSHFKSIALWETGGDGNQQRRDGWVTHDVEHALAINKIDAHGIALGGGMGVFSNAAGNWLSMSTAVPLMIRARPCSHCSKVLPCCRHRSTGCHQKCNICQSVCRYPAVHLHNRCHMPSI